MTVVIPCAVYRFYDAEDRLLYVGVTSSLGVRFGAHSRRDWWSDVARNTVEWYDTRAEALAVEMRAIDTEAPLHNVAGGTPPPPWEVMEPKPLAVPRRPQQQRRGKGTGGLAYRANRDLWVARVDFGYGPGGRRVIKEVSSRSREAAEAKLAALLEEQRHAS